MKFATLRTITAAIAAGNLAAASSAIDAALVQETADRLAAHQEDCAKLRKLARKSGKRAKLPAFIPEADWHASLRKLQATLSDGLPRFAIFAADGNGKLPFVAFSSLPGLGFCPGAGLCLDFCYSFRAWRYPAAFARQAQNAVLLQTAQGRTAILQALDAFRPDDGSALDFRLYVDGDFGSVAHVRFWMTALIARPWLRAYGYSKSWLELLAYSDGGEPWPANYLLNLSSGSLHDTATKSRASALPISRGEFIAVPVGYKVTSDMHGSRDHQARLREAYGDKAFTCPGKCGDCTPKGHACGSARFRGVPVIIAVH